MTEFRAKVRMRVNIVKFREQDNSFVGFLTNLLGDPDLGVIVTDIDEIGIVSDREYDARVHVRVTQAPEFERIEPKDYCRIHMADEEFGFQVLDVEIIHETN